MNKLILSLVLSVCTNSAFAGLLVNGNFETGDFTGWFVSQSGMSTQDVLPTSGDPDLGPSPTADFYAFSGNQSGPSQNIFWQSVIVPENILSANLAFDYSYSNNANVFFSPDTLAITDVDDTPNQQLRVDILLGTSLFDSVNPSDVVFSSIQTNPGSSYYQAWTSVNQDITSSLIGLQGQNVLVRFAQTDNTNSFDLGFDNVSIIARTTEVPEPSTLAIFALGMMGLVSRQYKKNS